MPKELDRLESQNKHQFSRRNIKTISNCKIPDHDGIHGFWFKKFISVHERLALEMNRCLQVAHLAERKDHIDPEWPLQGNRPKELHTNNLPTKGIDLLLAKKIIPWGEERMQQRNQGHRRVNLHRSANPQRDQDQTEKSSYTLDWLKKCHMVNWLKMYKISDEVTKYMEETMKTWKVEQTA